MYEYVVHLTGGPEPSAEVRFILNRHATGGNVALRLDGAGNCSAPATCGRRSA